jgi:deazaflavin-dependent oxidoreductase (nitroreductase family)
MEDERLRRVFNRLNKYFMVPAFRLGLGGLIGNPLTGYMMVIKTTGRKTGRVRYTPVNYAILDGCVYCMSGFGPKANWYANLLAHPCIEIILPGGTYWGEAEAVTDAAESLRATRQILKNGGFAGFMLGFNPFTASDDEVRQKCQGLPITRIRPVGIASGPADPGGWLWVAMILLSSFWLLNRRKKKGG